MVLSSMYMYYLWFDVILLLLLVISLLPAHPSLGAKTLCLMVNFLSSFSSLKSGIAEEQSRPPQDKLKDGGVNVHSIYCLGSGFEVVVVSEGLCCGISLL